MEADVVRLRSAKDHRQGAKERGELERQLHQADRLDSPGELAGGMIRATPAAAVRDVHHGHGERILVVEDNDALREIATRILTRAGYEVTAAAARDEALRFSDDKNLRLDLVLTDVIMPGISIRKFIDAVRAARPSLPVILMSGYATDPARPGDSLPDNFPMLTKPFQAATLLHQISTSLAGS
jgi:CheY-like chemotaxis protein